MAFDSNTPGKRNTEAAPGYKPGNAFALHNRLTPIREGFTTCLPFASQPGIGIITPGKGAFRFQADTVLSLWRALLQVVYALPPAAAIRMKFRAACQAITRFTPNRTFYERVIFLTIPVICKTIAG